MQLTIQCANNRKISHLQYESFVRASYLKKLDPNIARVIFKARTRMFDRKVNYKRKYKFNLDCHFCKYYYYMTNSYRPGIKKFDWFKAGL